MTPERWKQISRIYEGARLRAASDRAAFLTEACAGDASLQRDVQALLDQPTSPQGLAGLTPSAIAQAMGDGDTGLTGRRFGVYLVHERIGVGGMGEVYRARDTRLGRDVAIKVLPQVFATDADRLARFEREARVLASLDHPHIGTILGVEESDGVRGLVLGLVEGDTVAERIDRGPIPMAEALEYARQIADALEAAHEKGIVHRDLKPGNIKITTAGVIKVLDFGLAKATPPSAGEAPDATVTAVNATGSGVVLGTAAYMSPEQARGHVVDKRADIWAFGCVLFEMLTGRDAFAGPTPSDTLAAILERDPDLRALPTITSPSIERLLKRCFEKDPRRRLRDIGEARVAIDDAQHGRVLHDDSPRPVFRRWLTGTLLGVVLFGVVAAAYLVWTDVRMAPSSAESAARFFVGVTPADAFGPGLTRTNPLFPYPTRTDVALSPDGTLLVFSARKDGRQQLYLRTNQLESTPIAGTDNSNSPFFSPDGQWLGFWTGEVDVGAIGELKKMRLDGSPAVTVAKVPPLRGATWGSNDIVFATTEGEGRLWRVPVDGGMPEPLTRLDSKDRQRHSLPHMLTDGRGVLYTIGSPGSNFADGQVAVMSLATGDTHVVLDHGVDARYVPSGHLVYVSDGTLMAVPFDLRGLRVTGAPAAIVKGVMQAVRTNNLTVRETGAAQFSVSNTGVLVYVPSAPVPELLMSLVWVGRNGTVTPTTVPSGPYGGPRLSPDDKRISMHTQSRGTLSHDLARGGLMPVAPGFWSTFTPDGNQITTPEASGFVSTSIESGATDHFAIDAPGSPHVPGSWSPDGQTLLFTKFVDDGAWEIRALSRTGGDRKVHPSRKTAVNERYPQFSPDGEWFVYSSNERGQEQVYVERYRGKAERYSISTNGGTAPAWARSGREVFYETPAPEPGRIRMMAVDVTLSPAFVAGTPHMLFEFQTAPGTPQRNYDVSRDGRFLMVRGPEGPSPPPVTQMVLVLNWFEELKRLAPSDR
jgi:serine/threonine protein kinase/Tol biopolymer transport system component